MNKNPNIIIIDQTIREGMQHKGIVFSYSQRQKIIEFQEKIGVDICQAGYPPAHVTEKDNVKKLNDFVKKQGFKIKIAGMGRALVKDTRPLIETGIKDFHLHAHIHPGAGAKKEALFFSAIEECVKNIREQEPAAKFSLAMLDIGKTDPDFLEKSADFLINQLKINILSLPDTSGIIAPNLIYDYISPIAIKIRGTDTKISIHCHNDMGMASANTIMGIFAGATVIEASALGIGERNGIADIFTVGKILKDQGFVMNLNTDDIKTFKKYYEYVNKVYKTQTGEEIFNYNTPFFGDALKTHVAGTHGTTAFGISHEEKFFLNTLCGQNLVKKYLKAANIPFREEALHAITEEIKSQSASKNRRLQKTEIQAITAGI
ncbi:MAG: hypothetical protein U9N77_07775 [Thermodesulfobacteriota bacterium]|nr:hypothetical protein [Thermodesulfobacteriota bacterium]